MGVLENIRALSGKNALRIIKNHNNAYRLSVAEETGKTSYYFSIPIYTKAGELLTPEWRQDGELYTFEGINAKATATEKQLRLENEKTKLKIAFSGEVELEPTYNGVLVRSKAAEENVRIETQTNGTVKASKGCFAVLEEQTPYFSVSGIMGITENGAQPLIIKGEQTSYGFDLKISGKGILGEMLFEIDLYAQKSIFDTTVNEREKEENNNFGGVAFLSDGERKEELYTRFHIAAFYDVDPRKIDVATLCVPVYTKGGGKLQIRNIQEPWCSFGLNWATKKTGGRLIDEKEVKNGYVQLDVTKSLKEQLRMKTGSSYGVILSNPNKDTVIVSTADNYYKPQILKIKYKSKE